jgi:tryptophanyl-tRNA synthetase
LFDTDEVPVGEDQIQHVEFARDIAQKFNRVYGQVIRLPKFVIKKDSKLIPGLDGRKMSKSYGNHIPLFEEEKKLRSLVMKIKTDSTPPTEPKDPNQSIIMDLYKDFATAEQVAQLTDKYRTGIGWGEAKEALFVAMNENLKSSRENYDSLMANTDKLEVILQAGAKKARERAQSVLMRVRKAIGLNDKS